MLKYWNFDVVFAEVPDEVTLAVNLTNCPNRCAGCHSPHLQQDTGKRLDMEVVRLLLERYPSVTCIAIMGGDSSPVLVSDLLGGVRKEFPHLHTAWYSGRDTLAEGVDLRVFDYIKLGPYVAKAGPLTSVTTNQRFYKVVGNVLEDITYKFLKR